MRTAHQIESDKADGHTRRWSEGRHANSRMHEGSGTQLHGVAALPLVFGRANGRQEWMTAMNVPGPESAASWQRPPYVAAMLAQTPEIMFHIKLTTAYPAAHPVAEARPCRVSMCALVKARDVQGSREETAVPSLPTSVRRPAVSQYILRLNFAHSFRPHLAATQGAANGGSKRAISSDGKSLLIHGRGGDSSQRMQGCISDRFFL